jgi:hypothetical protein
MLPNKRGRVRGKGGSSRNWRPARGARKVREIRISATTWDSTSCSTEECRPAQSAAIHQAEQEEVTFRQLGRESLHFGQCRNVHHRTEDHHGARRESEYLRLEHGELATRPPVDGQSGRWKTARQSTAGKSRFIEADNLHDSKQ